MQLEVLGSETVRCVVLWPCGEDWISEGHGSGKRERMDIPLDRICTNSPLHCTRDWLGRQAFRFQTHHGSLPGEDHPQLCRSSPSGVLEPTFRWRPGVSTRRCAWRIQSRWFNYCNEGGGGRDRIGVGKQKRSGTESSRGYGGIKAEWKGKEGGRLVTD